MIIGLTGRVGSGKSWAAAVLADRLNFHVLDLDHIGHHLLGEPGVQKALRQEFGNEIFLDNRMVDRKKLGGIVFSSKERLQALDRIMHPKLKAEVKRHLGRSDGDVLIVGALIKEIGLTELCEKIVVVDAEDADIRKAVGPKADILKSQRSRDDYKEEGDAIVKNTFEPAFEEQCVRCVQGFLGAKRHA
jgi:dephospho-CoA kinase